MSVPQPCARGPSLSTDTMPALLERPKLSNAMARALHRHIMMERERKRQGEPGRGWLAPEAGPGAVPCSGFRGPVLASGKHLGEHLPLPGC